MSLALLTVFFALRAAALGHEPLWGETAQTFAFGVSHPELRLGSENDSLLLSGSKRLANPAGLGRSRLDSILSLQTAPQTALNLKLEIPYASVWNQQKVGGMTGRTNITGLGDITFSAKSRFGEQFGPTWKVHHAAILGFKLPTGVHNGRLAHGSMMSPSDQPGTGKWGIQVGYAFGYERMQDTIWLAAAYMHDFGGAGSRGDMWTLDPAYGYWLKRPTRPEHLGVLAAIGLHGEWTGKDRLAAGIDQNTGYSMIGVQSSFIVTKGRGQARIGAMVPFHQTANGMQLRPEIQLRAGAEMFF